MVPFSCDECGDEIVGWSYEERAKVVRRGVSLCCHHSNEVNEAGQPVALIKDWHLDARGIEGYGG